MHKLGDIYSSDKWVKKDIEMSNYYFNEAAAELIGDDYYEYKSFKYNRELDDYPSLCLALGIAMSMGGNINTDIDLALEFLIHAENGYAKAIRDGNTIYGPSFEKTLKLIDDPQFDEIREDHYLEYEDDDFNDDFEDYDGEKC